MKIITKLSKVPLNCYTSSPGGQRRREREGGIGKIGGVEGLEGSRRLGWTGRNGSPMDNPMTGKNERDGRHCPNISTAPLGQ